MYDHDRYFTVTGNVFERHSAVSANPDVVERACRTRIEPEMRSAQPLLDDTVHDSSPGDMGDEELVERMLASRSGLMRDKWDSRRDGTTYGAQTIERAIEGATEFYRPRAARRDGSSRPRANNKNVCSMSTRSERQGVPDGDDDADEAAEGLRLRAGTSTSGVGSGRRMPQESCATP